MSRDTIMLLSWVSFSIIGLITTSILYAKGKIDELNVVPLVIGSLMPPMMVFFLLVESIIKYTTWLTNIRAQNVLKQRDVATVQRIEEETVFLAQAQQEVDSILRTTE